VVNQDNVNKLSLIDDAAVLAVAHLTTKLQLLPIKMRWEFFYPYRDY
jgi:hypothetical protein